MRRHDQKLGAAALMLAVEYGWPILPCHPNTKAPLTRRGFHDASTHPEQIGAWWDRRPDAMIGVWPGPAGLVVIDTDNDEAEAAATAAGAHDETLMTRTARGWHRYFRLPPARIVGNVSGLGFDVRAHAGYVIVPPSNHPAGHVYAWHGTLDAIADVPRPLLEQLTRPVTQPIAPTLDDVLPLDRRDGETLRDVVAREKGRGRSEDAIVDDIDRRIQAYLATVGTHDEGDRNSTAYRVARWLVNDLAADDGVAWAYLVDWNTRNAPPLSSRELQTVFKSAHRSGRRPRGAAHHGSVA
jgi:hypothetical protein